MRGFEYGTQEIRKGKTEEYRAKAQSAEKRMIDQEGMA